MDDPTDIELLRAELAELRREVAELRKPQMASPPPESSDDAPVVIESAVTRRNWMKAAAAAAVGGTAVALGSAQPVAAAPDFDLGQTDNADGSRTSATHTGTDGDISFLFASRPTVSTTLGGGAGYPATLGAWTDAADKPNGVYGLSNVTTGEAHGVVGVTKSSQGAGVLAENLALGGTGLAAKGSTAGFGITTTGKFAMYAEGGRYGVVAIGGEAAIHIVPSSPVAPMDRSVEQSAGSIDTHRNGDDPTSNLWFCVNGGATGGDWRKLAGADSAGSFHAVEPYRAYDSRRPAPSPGTIAARASRTVSIKDGRSRTTGAVVSPDVVPNRARAITYNLTVDQTSAFGFLAVVPGDATSFGASTLNWAEGGQTIANAGVVKLDDSRQVKVFCGGGGSTHFIIDITGYYL